MNAMVKEIVDRVVSDLIVKRYVPFAWKNLRVEPSEEAFKKATIDFFDQILNQKKKSIVDVNEINHDEVMRIMDCSDAEGGGYESPIDEESAIEKESPIEHIAKTESEYMAMKLCELQNLCRTMRIKSTGTKKNLVDNIVKYFEGGSAPIEKKQRADTKISIFNKHDKKKRPSESTNVSKKIKRGESDRDVSDFAFDENMAVIGVKKGEVVEPLTSIDMEECKSRGLKYNLPMDF